jgi:membrane protease YdiL (CAAX protease family)
VQKTALDPPPPPPPGPPELPEDAAPRWPAWYAGVGFLVALIGTTLVVGILGAALGVTADDEDATFSVVATFLQALVFIGTAVLFASLTSPPRAEQFGLRPTRFWPAVRWALTALAVFYLAVWLYTVILQPDAEQSVAQDLGADEGTVGLLAAGFMLICVAPVAEEFFFRGFFYRALRTRYAVLPAALIDGLLFGVVHYDFSGADALLFIPPLALLGVLFCLVYERTGSLYPVIAMHALNNAIAYGWTIEKVWPSVAFGSVVLLACAAVPRAQRAAMA